MYAFTQPLHHQQDDTSSIVKLSTASLNLEQSFLLDWLSNQG